jgi:outer membrane receptor protein involved in Fe transport
VLNRGGSILRLTAAPYNLTFRPDGSITGLPLGSETYGQQTVGGGGQSLYDYMAVSAPYKRTNLFGRASYDLTDDLTFWANASYNRMAARYSFFPETSVSVVMPDNAFLTDTAKAQLAVAGVSTPFALGRILDDVGPDRMLTFGYTRRNVEGAVGFDGKFGNGWTYKAYYDHGELRNAQTLSNQRITANYANAIDAVLANGTPTCRVNADASKANDDPACVPINILGNGNITTAGVAYAFGAASQTTTTLLDTAGASLGGQLFSTWAGPVDIAIGADFRWEKFVTNSTDALSLAGSFSTLNYAATRGQFDVREFFGEVNVPLLDLADIARLEVNGAARYSDYSTSGGIWSWKMGGTLHLIDDLLLRAVYSRDIRSPSISEYYLNRATNITTALDPYKGNALVPNVISYTGGDPNLQPEVSHTLTFGGSLSPHIVPGLRLSVDYYRIKIDDVIVTLQSQDVLNLCAAQSPGDALCGGLIARDANGTLASVQRTFRNLAQYKTRGLDIEAVYQVPLDKGRLTARVLATHVMELLIDDGVTVSDRAGIVGGDTAFSTPKWRVSSSLGYEDDRFGSDLRMRYVSGGQYTNITGGNGKLPLNNRIASRTYFDLGVRFKVAEFTLFGNVNNLFDRDPPMTQYSNPNYDVIGRYFSGGVRLNF